MRLHLGSFIAGAIVAVAVTKVLKDGLPRIRACARACCEDGEDPAGDDVPSVEEEEQEQAIVPEDTG